MARTKAEWRRMLLAARAALSPAARHELSAAISGTVARIPAFGAARTLFAYLTMGAEVDPARLLEESRASTIVVPANTGSGDSPAWSRWGGSPGDRVDDEIQRRPALVLVPGVGFDERGMRLGRGRGFYDRALADLRIGGGLCVVGLAFECQIVPEIACDPWDQPMDYVVSEKRVIVASTACGSSDAEAPLLGVARTTRI